MRGDFRPRKCPSDRMEGSATALRGTITALLWPVAAGFLRSIARRIAGLLALNADDDAATGIHAKHTGGHIGRTQLTGPFTLRALRVAGPVAIERLGKDRRVGMHDITFLIEIGILPCILCGEAKGGSDAAVLPKKNGGDEKCTGALRRIGSALRCTMVDGFRPARRGCPCGRGGAAARRTPRRPAAAARR